MCTQVIILLLWLLVTSSLFCGFDDCDLLFGKIWFGCLIVWVFGVWDLFPSWVLV